jgi:tetratricopeptide (TPR) repeat protein
MAIPITVRFAVRCRWRGWRGILCGGLLLLQIAGVGASLSYGAVVSLAVATLIVFMRVPVKRRGWVLGFVATAGAAAGTALLVLRASEGASPLALRLGNWGAAWKVFLSAPLFGVGFGTLVDAYPRVMAEGMNETAFVHNSYLQFATEGGALALLWVIGAAIHLVVRIPRSTSSREGGFAEVLVGIAPLSFLVHNLFDFSAYLPSISITFAILAGAAAGSGSKEDARGKREAAQWTTLPRSALLLLLLGGTAWELRDAWSRQSLEAGRDLVAAGRWEEGTEILRRAAGRNPSNPDLPAMLAEIDLSRAADELRVRAEGERFARRAVELRPERAYGHYILAMYLLAAGDRGEAWSELARARKLYPGRELYAQEESRLRQMIAAGPGTGMETDAPR